jgi:hypothetical protein
MVYFWVSAFPTQESSFPHKKMLLHRNFFKISIIDQIDGFLNHFRVLNIKIISQINLFLIILKKTIEK